jgi:hypothetical protein
LEEIEEGCSLVKGTEEHKLSKILHLQIQPITDQKQLGKIQENSKEKM